MPFTIRFRRGTSTPSVSSFVEGEPAVNTSNGRFYVRIGGGMVELAPILLTENAAQTGAYTLVPGDLGRVVSMNSATAVTVTVPTYASAPFPIGSVVYVYNQGAGAVTLAGTGITFRNNTGTIAQYKEISLRQRAIDEWVVTGL